MRTRPRILIAVADDEATGAESRWRYQPPTIDGRPVQVSLTGTVTFRLEI